MTLTHAEGMSTYIYMCDVRLIASYSAQQLVPNNNIQITRRKRVLFANSDRRYRS